MKAVNGYNRLAPPHKTANRNHSRRLAIFNKHLPKQLVVSN